MLLVGKNKMPHSIRGIIRFHRASERTVTCGNDVRGVGIMINVLGRVYSVPWFRGALDICRTLLQQRLEMI